MLIIYLLGFLISTFVLTFLDQKTIKLYEEDNIAGLSLIGCLALFWPFTLILVVAGAVFVGPFYLARKMARK